MPAGGQFRYGEDLSLWGNLGNGALAGSHEKVVTRYRVPLDARRLEPFAADAARQRGGLQEDTADLDELFGIDGPAIYRYQARLPGVPGVFADEQQHSLVRVVGESLYFVISSNAGCIQIVENGCPVGAFAKLVQPS